MGRRPHQRLWWDLQAGPLDLGVLHLRLAAGLRQVNVLITDVLLLSSATETTPDLGEAAIISSRCASFVPFVTFSPLRKKQAATLPAADFCQIIIENIILNRKLQSAHSSDLGPCTEGYKHVKNGMITRLSAF